MDIADRRHVAGWVHDTLHPERTVWLTLWLDGQPIQRIPANRFRRDLREAGLGSGRYGFTHIFTPPLDPLTAHDMHLTHGEDPFGAPITLNATNALTHEVKNRFLALLQGLDTVAECETALQFLTQAAQDLRDSTARKISRAHDRDFEKQARRRHRPTNPVAPAILFVDDQPPDPARDAGSIALLSHMRAIRNLGYRICFVSSRRTTTEEDRVRLKALDIECLMAPLISGPEDALRRLGDGLEAVYLHRLNNAESYSALTRAFAPTATLIWSLADLASLRLRRQALTEHRPELERMAAALEVRENMCAWLADLTLTHSNHEADGIRRTVPTAQVHVVPWAVPVLSRKRQTTARPVITFLAHFAHAPNVDAAKWLVLDILPRLRVLLPDVVCQLVGSAMPHAIHQLTEPGVEIIGFVPDLKTALSETQLCVAPLRFGAGIKGKVLQSWSAGLPIILTPVAAEGLVDPETTPWSDAIAADSVEFARKTAEFLTTPALGRTQVTAARKLLREHYSESVIEGIFRPLLPSVDQETPEFNTPEAEPSLH